MPADPADADRDAAARALWPLARYRWPRPEEMTDEQAQQWDRVARALADERERARRPFLALADELDERVQVYLHAASGSYDAGLRTAYYNASERIRTAAQEDPK